MHGSTVTIGLLLAIGVAHFISATTPIGSAPKTVWYAITGQVVVS